ncbi:MAG: hypothetical protein K0R09_2720 [Clostridiales bacterium]|jgi:hypothetical protein|nr:hypothetical protein [Clostridiales bacterium]
MDEWEVIVEFGAAGGKILIYGKMLGDSKWKFILRTQEYSLKDILYEGEKDLLTSKEQSSGDWNQAIYLMNKYPWKSMCPIRIHPMFKAFLWDKVNYDNSFADCSVKWYTKCFIPEEEEEFQFIKPYAIHE